MAKDVRGPSLSIVDPASTIVSPPRQLGPHGTNLWNGILSEFEVRDRAGLELLAQAAACLDRAESLAEGIAADGAVIRTRAGVRSHPSVKDEIQARTAVVRILQRLGVTEEPLRPGPGHPPGKG
jgi:hypothetical protein